MGKKIKGNQFGGKIFGFKGKFPELNFGLKKGKIKGKFKIVVGGKNWKKGLKGKGVCLNWKEPPPKGLGEKP